MWVVRCSRRRLPRPFWSRPSGAPRTSTMGPATLKLTHPSQTLPRRPRSPRRRPALTRTPHPEPWCCIFFRNSRLVALVRREGAPSVAFHRKAIHRHKGGLLSAASEAHGAARISERTIFSNVRASRRCCRASESFHHRVRSTGRLRRGSIPFFAPCRSSISSADLRGRGGRSGILARGLSGATTTTIPTMGGAIALAVALACDAPTAAGAYNWAVVARTNIAVCCASRSVGRRFITSPHDLTRRERELVCRVPGHHTASRLHAALRAAGSNPALLAGGRTD